MPRAPRRGRLSRSAEFERVYRQGRSLGNRHLVLYAFPTAGTDRPRLGLSVSRKVGGAVHRNRVKRMLRDAFARLEPSLAGGQDLVIVARPEVRELAEREGMSGVDSALGELVDRAGLRRGGGGEGGGGGGDGDGGGDGYGAWRRGDGLEGRTRDGGQESAPTKGAAGHGGIPAGHLGGAGAGDEGGAGVEGEASADGGSTGEAKT